jgi:hypothetical protein
VKAGSVVLVELVVELDELVELVEVVTGVNGPQTILAPSGVALRVPNWSSITIPGRATRGHLTL